MKLHSCSEITPRWWAISWHTVDGSHATGLSMFTLASPVKGK